MNETRREEDLSGVGMKIKIVQKSIDQNKQEIQGAVIDKYIKDRGKKTEDLRERWEDLMK